MQTRVLLVFLSSALLTLGTACGDDGSDDNGSPSSSSGSDAGTSSGSDGGSSGGGEGGSSGSDGGSSGGGDGCSSGSDGGSSGGDGGSSSGDGGSSGGDYDEAVLGFWIPGEGQTRECGSDTWTPGGESVYRRLRAQDDGTLLFEWCNMDGSNCDYGPPLGVTTQSDGTLVADPSVQANEFQGEFGLAAELYTITYVEADDALEVDLRKYDGTYPSEAERSCREIFEQDDAASLGVTCEQIVTTYTRGD